MNCHSQVWKIRSKGAILTLILRFPIAGTCFTVLNVLSDTVLQGSVTDGGGSGAIVAGLILMGLACPVAGWLADTCVTRYKVVHSGFWLMWLGMLCLTATVSLAYIFPHCEWCHICFTVGELAGSVLYFVGFMAYEVNAVQFGIDQMPGASSDELSAYVHWFWWAYFAGGAIGANSHLIKDCVSALSNGYLAGAIQLLLLTSMLSLALCCEFIFQKWLIIEPECPNSLRTIYRVLKFAATHKYPIRRRAITYTEDEKPSRIDFAKDKYGGPFTTEQVEDVKTFFRVILVVISTSLLFVPLVLVVHILNFLLALSSYGHCLQKSLTSTFPASSFTVAVTPVYMFVLHPLLKSKMFSMLQQVALAAVLTVILSGAILMISTVKHSLDPNLVCMFNAQGLKVLHLDLWWVIPFNFTIALGTVASYSTIVEFTTAQSPYSMRGLLLGLQFFITYTVTLSITYGIIVAWKNFKVHISPSCDFYYFLFQFLCAMVGLILLCIVARWYKRRQREEEDDQRRIVEEIYDRVVRSQSLSCNTRREKDLNDVSS